jgi:hypothetical protein
MHSPVSTTPQTLPGLSLGLGLVSYSFSLIRNALRGSYPSTVLSHIANNDRSTVQLWNFFTANTVDVIYGVPSLSTYLNAMVTTWSTREQLAIVRSTMAYVLDLRMVLFSVGKFLEQYEFVERQRSTSYANGNRHRSGTNSMDRRE